MNFQDESDLDAGIEEHEANVHGTKGFGLAQWTGPRRDALVQFAAANGKPASDADLQMDFLMQELQGPESGAWAKIQAARTSGEAGAAIVNIRQDGFAHDDALDHARAPALMRMARWSSAGREDGVAFPHVIDDTPRAETAVGRRNRHVQAGRMAPPATVSQGATFSDRPGQ